ncbi:DUF2218 domain-containing protein [Rubrimonas cliftonensis]|uniref:DUF2218 domain-containing protein n=1 Tax=Rubrimonas cliftonensis TaxID=89524 RepID=A0A1H4EZZ7_9RHOB|nr:DUF2218 domain-containing protein [Rubrimonas cliftonensis]SEA90604.1 hypothetical protein SAMN05444370_11737 [Rubrimonas cliftonensis]
MDAAPLRAEAAFATDAAAAYIAKLCKHFRHKIEASWDDASGEARFPGAVARFTASAGRLDIAIDAEDAASMTRAKAVVEDHLLRFAFREQPEALDWRESGGLA